MYKNIDHGNDVATATDPMHQFSSNMFTETNMKGLLKRKNLQNASAPDK